ncbi:toll/interleukin-1 receptor domain-containing protein [Mucilaginibacter endophyticus]|uniref:toll/interleukin-1 receptor domain-containing protein n=1 Tax=Mucilaginibacter endophyticus TaxID=2675003 RepID=UPI000E0CF198|nr:toll/interleukin-1 receptor domain-containing protein [Mucilaginibacter endophyticus]
MEYKYDIFISYKRDYKFGYSDMEKYSLLIRQDWITKVFLIPLLHNLTAEIGKAPTYFLDVNEIKIGDQYERELRENLAKSKCMVVILSNPYLYDSEWCLREFCFMKLRRETSAGKLQNTFIFPILYQKTNLQHPLISDLEIPNYIKYDRNPDLFIRSPEYLEFQEKIQSVAATIGEVINEPPAWEDKWLSEKWWTEVKDNVNIYNKLTLDRTLLSRGIQL